MSTQQSQNKNTVIKIKLDKLDENVSSIADKRLAITKYCKENCIEKNRLDELHKLG